MSKVENFIGKIMAVILCGCMIYWIISALIK